MPTLTGSKANGVLSAVGTHSVTVGTTPFVSADFAVSRYAVLFTSANVFKGIARVRRWVSTSVVELTARFYDPLDGSLVTQAVGDIVHISLNFSEVSGTGYTYTAAGPVVTERLIFGVAGQQASLVLHDESKVILSTWANTSANSYYSFVGGVTIFGHQAEPGSLNVFRGCHLAVDAPTATQIYSATMDSGSANLFMFGGSADSLRMAPAVVDKRAITCNAYNRAVFVSCSTGVTHTPSGTAALVALKNGTYEQTANFQAIFYPGGVVVDGGIVRGKVGAPNYGVFRVQQAGPFTYGASAGQRMIVVDADPAFTALYSSVQLTSTVRLRNFVGAPRGWSSSAPSIGSPNDLGTSIYSFQDTYTGLITGSIAQVRLDSDDSLEASDVVAGTTWSPEVVRDRWVGKTRSANYPRGPWTYGIKRYGRAPVSGSIVPSTYDLGAGGTADNVAFGGSVVQAVDAAVTRTEAAALALISIDTLDDLYDALIAWGCSSVSNAAYPSLSTYPCESDGGSINIGAHDLVVDGAAATALAVDTSSGVITIRSASLGPGVKHTELTTTGMVSSVSGGAITALYTDATGRHVAFAAPALIAGSIVQVYDLTAGSQLYLGTLPSDGFLLPVTWTADHTLRIRAEHATKLALETVAVLTSSGATVLDSQVEDERYAEKGIDGTAVTELSADLPNIQIDINDPDGMLDIWRLYAWAQAYQNTPEGIASDFFGAITSPDDATVVIDQAKADIKLDNVSSWPVRVVGGYLARKDGSTVIAATSGSIQMDPKKAYVATLSGGLATAAQVAALGAPLQAADYTAPVSTAELQGAVRAELAPELARLDVAVSTRLADADYTEPPAAAPTLAQIGQAVAFEINAADLATADALAALPAPLDAAATRATVRAELAPELARLDVAVSTRLASADYTEPPAAAPTLAQIGQAVAAEIDAAALATAADLAELPVPLTALETQAAAAAAVAGADLATAAQVTALGQPLQAADYTAPPAAGGLTPEQAAQLDAVQTATALIPALL